MNSGLISVNTAWDLSREHWWDLINFESILFLYSLIVCLSKTPSLPLQMESWAQYLGDCIYSCSIGNYIFFFSTSFLIFWNSINLAYVSQLGNEDLVDDYIFTSQRESHSLPDMGFLLYLQFFVPWGLIENKFTKISFKYFNGDCDYFSCPGWWILFLYAPPHKGLIFEKLSLS